ncbi:MAG: hypothetical protein J0L87_14255 [Bacteroidetes bacterium]|nr:hypothetical protein [Bacteroidota bacterium]
MNNDTGIVLYTIEQDGCLNGIYTNESCDGEIFNEIARKDNPSEGKDIIGSYNCFYFENKNNRVNAKLTISLRKSKKRTYDFSWNVDNKILFKGIGYKTSDKQIVVHYWDI